MVYWLARSFGTCRPSYILVNLSLFKTFLIIFIISRVNVDTNARSFHCDFNFFPDEDVTEMTENIFAQFDDTNNQFNNVNFHFGGEDKSPANFAMNEKTTGKLQFKDLSSISLCMDGRSGS